ncbi:MAG TPA: NAD(P)-dependent alcohol dehydrogenase [Pseudonocardia sp.]
MQTTRSLVAAVSRSAGEPMGFEQLTLEEPRDDEVLVEVHYAGICHTDINCHHGRMPTPRPVVLGHEGAGTVVEVGARVTELSPGDRVLMTFMSCGRCRVCRSGRPAYCPSALALNFLAGRADGSNAYRDTEVRGHFFGQSSFATLAMANERNVVRVPDELPLDRAAVLGCGVMTGAGTVLNSLRVTPGSSVAVFGAGAVGLSALLAARIAGASTVVAVDTVRSRLALATELGASHTLAAGADTAAVLTELTGGGVDFCVEASGSPVALTQAIDCLGSGGSCAAVGTVNEPASPSWRALRLKGATIRGVVEGDANPPLLLPQLFGFHAQGRFPFERLISNYDFTKINDAIADAESGVAIKPVLAVGGTR